MTALVAVPDQADTAALRAEADAIVARATSLQVTDAESYALAAEFGKGVKALQRRIVEFLAPHKANAHKAWKDLCDEERKQLAPAEQAEKIVKDKMLVWQRAETQRLEAEQRAREKEAERLEEERRLQQALDADEDGDAALADELLLEPIAPPPPVAMAPAAPKIAGVSASKRWTFDEKLVDIVSVLCHIAGVEKLAHPELVTLLALDTRVARQLITAMRENFNVPGIRAYQADGMSFGSK